MCISVRERRKRSLLSVSTLGSHRPHETFNAHNGPGHPRTQPVNMLHRAPPWSVCTGRAYGVIRIRLYSSACGFVVRGVKGPKVSAVTMARPSAYLPAVHAAARPAVLFLPLLPPRLLLRCPAVSSSSSSQERFCSRRRSCRRSISACSRIDKVGRRYRSPTMARHPLPIALHSTAAMRQFQGVKAQ